VAAALSLYNCTTVQLYTSTVYILVLTSQMVAKPMSCSSHNDFTNSSSYRHSNNSKVTHNALQWGIFYVLSRGTYKKNLNMCHKQHKQTPDSNSLHQNHFQLTTVAQVELGEQSDIPGITWH